MARLASTVLKIKYKPACPGNFAIDLVPKATSAKPSKLKLKKPTRATRANAVKVASSAPPPTAVKESTEGKGGAAPTIVRVPLTPDLKSSSHLPPMLRMETPIVVMLLMQKY